MTLSVKMAAHVLKMMQADLTAHVPTDLWEVTVKKVLRDDDGNTPWRLHANGECAPLHILQ